AAAAAGCLPELRVGELRADFAAGDHGQHDLGLLALVRLDEHVDLTAARQSYAERHLVGAPVRDQTWLPAGEHFLRGQDDVALDAAVRDRPLDAAVVAHDELRPDRARGRTPRRDNRRDSGIPLRGAVHAAQSSRATARYLPRYALRRPS